MDFWWTLCSSVKQTKVPYLFDWEQGIALHTMQGNQASSLSEGEFAGFSRDVAGPRVHSRVSAGVAINNFSFIITVRTPF